MTSILNKSRLVFVFLGIIAATQFVRADTAPLSVSEHLQKAQEEYEAGNLRAALATLESARITIEGELYDTNPSIYIKINDWEDIFLNKDRYMGKRIKFSTQFTTINSDGTLWLSYVDNWCSLDSSLRDRVQKLEKYHTYSFSGILCEDNDFIGPYIHIEKIEEE